VHGRSRLSGCLALGVAVIALAGPRAAVAQEWSGVHRLVGGSTVGRADPCDVAIRPSGEVIATWTESRPRRSSGVRTISGSFARRSASGRWSRPTVIWKHKIGIPRSITSNGVYGYCPSIAPGHDGSIDFLFTQQRETALTRTGPVYSGPSMTYVRRLSASGSWSAPKLLARARSLNAVEVNARGDAIAVVTGRRADVISRSPSGRWSAPRPLPNRHGAFVALGEGGDALAAWPESSRVMAKVRSPGGTWSAARTVAKSTRTCDIGRGVEFQLAAGPAGDMAVGWGCSGYQNRQYLYAMQVVPLPHGGVWGAPETLDTATVDSEAPPFTEHVTGFTVAGMAFDAGGTAHVAYLRGVQPAGQPPTLVRELRVSDRPAAAPWTAPAAVATFGNTDARLVLQPDGAGLVLASGSTDHPAMEAVARSAAGAWSAPTEVPKARLISGPLTAVNGGVTAVMSDAAGFHAVDIAVASLRP
jgi:hypothetical protein